LTQLILVNKKTNMNRMNKPAFIIFVLLAGFLASCNSNSNKTADTSTVAKDTSAAPVTPAPAPVVTENANWQTTPGLYAVISTAKGDIVCELEFQKTPVTVANFVGLAEGKIKNTFKKPGQPYFDGLTFHRVEPGFVIQGGDPKGNGSGNPGYQFDNEITDLKHDRAGTLAMANAGPNTNGSQIYITLQATPQLDGHYSVFGYVVNGMAAVKQIAVGDLMKTVKIVRVGDAATAFDAAKTFEGKEKQAVDPAQAMAQKKADFKKQYSAQIAQIVSANAAYQPAWDKKVKAKFPNAKKTSTGLYYIITQQGTGAQAQQFDNVKVHYTGVLWDGTKFDSSVDRGTPLDLMLGVGKVIPGWDEGIALLKKGGKGKLIIPFYLAYGDQSPGASIPAKSDLIFDVELVDITQ
jgi:peptidyl-prolyl cis-trans isomerase A (cyclophilin A)